MRLSELHTRKLTVGEVISALKQRLGLIQNGGPRRFYRVDGSNQIAVVFVPRDSLTGIGFAWTAGEKAIETVYVWRRLDVGVDPDIAIDIPVDAALEPVVDQLVQFVSDPKPGTVDDALTEAEVPPASNDDETPDEQQASEPEEPAPTTQPVTPAKAAPVAKPVTKDDTVKIRRLADKGRVVLMARKADGSLFEVPGLNRILTKYDRMLDAEVKRSTGGKSMEDQYEDVLSKVRAVVTGKNRFIKALLITGMASAGKSYRVLQILKELKLARGRDYVQIKGKVTAASLYRIFIEQNGGLTIFDDADSIWDDDDAVNMMKGALDTDPVRTITYSSAATLNTKNMDVEERDELVAAMSRILRGRPGVGDLERFQNIKGFRSLKEYSKDAYEADLALVQKFIMRSPPSQIDFTGRVIFISNRDQSEFDPAMFTRIDHVNMDFPDEEMLDFVEKIADKLENVDSGSGVTPLTPEQIEEVFAVVRKQLGVEGFVSRVNFRFIQKCFDYRRSQPNWKAMIEAL